MLDGSLTHHHHFLPSSANNGKHYEMEGPICRLLFGFRLNRAILSWAILSWELLLSAHKEHDTKALKDYKQGRHSCELYMKFLHKVGDICKFWCANGTIRVVEEWAEHASLRDASADRALLARQRNVRSFAVKVSKTLNCRWSAWLFWLLYDKAQPWER